VLLETLQQYIASGITATVYIDFLPAQPDDAVCIRGYGGMQSTDMYYDTENIQIISRATSYNIAKYNAYVIYRAIHMYSNSDIRVVDIFAMQPPYFLGRDDLKRYTFVNNYRVDLLRETV
jgi:hypothetical protein